MRSSSRRTHARCRASVPAVERLEARQVLAVDLFSVTPLAAAAPAPGFQIDVVFPDSSLTPSQQLVFKQAAARWSQIIVGDLPDVTVDNVVIDDIRISARGESIDGQYGTLGTGGPTNIKPGARPPAQGQMTFDTADLPRMERDGTLLPVILHEMGHAFGLGTLWSFRDLLGSRGYVGANALREYRSIFGIPDAPAVPVAGSGHWDEGVLKNELMTPMAEQPGTPMPISRITVGALQDLGYSVNYAAADPYSAPGSTTTVTVGDVTVVEGNASTTATQVTVTFTLSQAASATTSVDYATADGTATVAGNDYLSAAGTVTFAVGESQKTVVLSIVGDTVAEENETFTIRLSNPVSTTLGRQFATITITNDDSGTPPPAGLPAISIADISVAEGNSGTSTALLAVVLSAPSATPVTVQYATANGTATTADGDYTAASGTLTFAPGETQRAIPVTIRGDAKIEPTERFTVRLSAPRGATLSRTEATVTITNDDSVEPPAAFSLSVNDITVTEGNSGTTVAEFTVSLSGAARAPVSVWYATADGTATVADRDYLAARGTVTFLPGETQKTVRVSVTGDVRPEGAETFTIVLSSPSNATLAKSRGMATIANDDTVAISVSIADASIREGNFGERSISFVVTLSAPARETVSVKLRTADGSARAGADYLAESAKNIVFARGTTRQTVTVRVKGDTSAEADETFTVELFDAVGASLGRSLAQATILNDDAPLPANSLPVAAWAHFAQPEPASVGGRSPRSLSRI